MCHMRTSAIGEHHTLADFLGEMDHAVTQSRKHDGRHLAGSGYCFQVFDEFTHVSEWFSCRDTDSAHSRCMADTDAEAKPAVGDFMDETHRLRKVIDVARVDWRDTRTDQDVVGTQRESFTQRKIVAQARAEYTRATAPFDFLCYV